MKEKECRCKF